MHTFAFIFPGQGSQSVGMLADLAARFPVVAATFAEASEVLGYDLWKLCQEGPEDALNQTDKTQPALLAASVAIWRVWRELGGAMPQVMAGHSFGEYSALVCAEAVSFKDAVGLAQARGQFMQAAVATGVGAVAAILGLDDEQVIAACAQSAQGEVVTAVNFNAPAQVVIAGHKAAVERTMDAAKAMGAKRTILLPISVPVHCSLMRPAADNMALRLAEVSFQAPKVPILHNVDISAKTEASEIREALAAQIYHPVRWVETIHAIAAQGVETVVECGAGKVLVGLNKRIVKSMNTYNLSDVAGLEAAIKAME